MKALVQSLLRYFTSKIIRKYQPTVIAITGSVGKTSTKDAIYTVLGSKFRVARNIKNYNNELGVPLTFLGVKSPGKSVVGWLKVFLHALKLLMKHDPAYPEIVVVEMGADKPGDIRYLMNFVKPTFGVITAIAESHMEFFGSLETIKIEKSDAIRFLPSHGHAVLNIDDENVRKVKNETKAQVVTYGFSEDASVHAHDLMISGQPFGEKTDLGNIRGVSFKVRWQGSNVPVMLPNVLGRQQVSAALAAIALGLLFDMNLVEISESLRRYDPPNGRMNLIAGIKHTLIIDDTYNSSPTSAVAALDAAGEISLEEGAKKFAVLGDMLELGAISEASHISVGKYVKKKKFDVLLTVGERARDIAQGAREAGMSEDLIFSFADSETAGRFLQERMSMGDLILVKGSQGVRMEKIVKEIMADPLRAKELLVRQDEEWVGKN